MVFLWFSNDERWCQPHSVPLCGRFATLELCGPAIQMIGSSVGQKLRHGEGKAVFFSGPFGRFFCGFFTCFFFHVWSIKCLINHLKVTNFGRCFSSTNPKRKRGFTSPALDRTGSAHLTQRIHEQTVPIPLQLVVIWACNLTRYRL